MSAAAEQDISDCINDAADRVEAMPESPRQRLASMLLRMAALAQLERLDEAAWANLDASIELMKEELANWQRESSK